VTVDLTAEPVLLSFAEADCAPVFDAPRPHGVLPLARGTRINLLLGTNNPKDDDNTEILDIQPLCVPAFLAATADVEHPSFHISASADAPTGQTAISFLTIHPGLKRVRRFPVDLTEPLDCTLMPIPDTGAGAHIRFSVQNLWKHPFDVNAILETTLTKGLRPHATRAYIAAVAPGETKSVDLHVDSAPNPVADYWTRAQIQFAGGPGPAVQANLVFTPALLCRKKPHVDGRLDEWNEFPIVINGVSGARRDAPGSDADDPADIAAVAAAKWSLEHLHLAVDVTDDTHHNAQRDGALWDGDSVQIGLTMSPDDEDAERCEFTVGRGADGTQVWVTTNLTGRITGPVDWPAAVVRADDGHTRYEISIPWADIAGPGARLARETWLGLGILVNEDDGAGRGWIGWHRGIASDKNPALYGQITLMLEPRKW
jgi:hypothetical protein